MLKRLLVASCTTLLLAGSCVAGTAEQGRNGEHRRPQVQGSDRNGDSTLGTGDLGTSGSGATGDELPDRNPVSPEASAKEPAPYPYD